MDKIKTKGLVCDISYPSCLEDEVDKTFKGLDTIDMSTLCETPAECVITDFEKTDSKFEGIVKALACKIATPYLKKHRPPKGKHQCVSVQYSVSKISASDKESSSSFRKMDDEKVETKDGKRNCQLEICFEEESESETALQLWRSLPNSSCTDLSDEGCCKEEKAKNRRTDVKAIERNRKRQAKRLWEFEKKANLENRRKFVNEYHRETPMPFFMNQLCSLYVPGLAPPMPTLPPNGVLDKDAPRLPRCSR